LEATGNNPRHFTVVFDDFDVCESRSMGAANAAVG
jgi:hypothetical protein